MGQKFKENWWLVIAGVLGAMLVVMGVGLPFEDRTLGAVFGGIVIGSLGLSMLLGIRVRRSNRRLGGMMIAVGTLPTFPFFWTIFLPILGLAVFIPAIMDAADADATGNLPPGSPATGPRKERDTLTVLAFALLMVAIAASAIVATGTFAAAACAPPLALFVAARVRLRLRMPTRPADLGFTAFITGLVHSMLLMVAAIWGDPGTVDLGEPVAVALGAIVSGIGTIGLVVWIVAMISARDRARPA